MWWGGGGGSKYWGGVNESRIFEINLKFKLLFGIS